MGTLQGGTTRSDPVDLLWASEKQMSSRDSYSAISLEDNCMGVDYYVVTELLVTGCGSKNRYPKWNLVSGNMDQHLRNHSWLILSHTQLLSSLEAKLRIPGPSSETAPFQAPG